MTNQHLTPAQHQQAVDLFREAEKRGNYITLENARTAVRASIALKRLGIAILNRQTVLRIPYEIRGGTRVLLLVLGAAHGKNNFALIAILNRLEKEDRLHWSRPLRPFVPREPQPVPYTPWERMTALDAPQM